MTWINEMILNLMSKVKMNNPILYTVLMLGMLTAVFIIDNFVAWGLGESIPQFFTIAKDALIVVLSVLGLHTTNSLNVIKAQREKETKDAIPN
jgi:hypothetical protein